MSNNLNDIMEVLRENAGCLTETDRNIPEADEAVIRYSAGWLIPILETEDETNKFRRQNNQVQIIDYHSQNSENCSKNHFKMRRRSQTASESRSRSSLRAPESVDSQTTEYHYMYNDISIGMGELTVNQQPLREDETDSIRTSSPESETNSEWIPGPSSVETVENSISPSPFESGIESRRLSRSQRRNMTEEEIERRRKEANKKNSKNYNKNKKQKEKDLKNSFERQKVLVEEMKENGRTMKNMLLECYNFIGTVVIISDEEVMRTFITRDVFEERLRSIDSENQRNQQTDPSVKKLAMDFQKKKRIYEQAKNDTKLKKTNTNTYGSRKSRALHTKNIALLELELAKLVFEKQRFRSREDFMNTVRKQMAPLFTFRYIGARYIDLSEERTQFDDLCRRLKDASPTRTHRASQ
uniref:BZIP domain-containing protein n=1 Tax=Caenorhabditis tropicalis TaxID=1561998 RepID=A0A1I7TMH5_9PELO